MPRLLLNQNKITNAEDILSVTYVGSRKQVVDDVMMGKVDIGGCGCAEVDKAREHGAFEYHAVLIGSFTDIPLGPIFYGRQLDKKVA